MEIFVQIKQIFGLFIIKGTLIKPFAYIAFYDHNSLHAVDFLKITRLKIMFKVLI